MATEKLDPAFALISRLGGPAAVADATGAKLPTVHRWTYPANRGGTDGFIPRRHHDALLRLAREKGVEITAHDFLDVQTGEAA